MKKIFTLLACAFIVSISFESNAQVGARFLPLLDTNVNSATRNIVTAPLIGNSGFMSFQYVGTKVTGTVAGKVILQASLDGTNYSSIDSLTLVDIATNTKTFFVNDKRCYQWRFNVTTSGGTIANKGYWLEIKK